MEENQGLRTHYAYGDCHNGISDEQLLLPMQHQAAGEMPASLNRGHPRQHLFNITGKAVDQSQRLRCWRLLTEPFLVIRRYMDGTIEGLRPSRIRGVVMRMGDHNAS